MTPNETTVGRRAFLAAAAAAGSVAAATRAALAQDREDVAPGEPIRYPDDEHVLALDKRFEKYKIGNTPIQKLYQGTLWAEGTAWNGAGRYLIWSDIPND